MRLENIRFKAKRLDNSEWVSGDLLHSYDGGAIIVPITKVGESKGGAFSVDPTTVCQYTGLKDSKGQDIWEHDLLMYKYSDRKLEVVWNTEFATFALEYFKLNEILNVSLGRMLRNCGVINICGNKFDKEESK